MEKEVIKEDFWNKEGSNKVISELSELKKIKDKILYFEKALEIKKELNEEDEELKKIIISEINKLEIEVNSFETLTLLNKEFDDMDCVLEIHSGAGGTESCDWVNMLYRMYTRWCEKNNYKCEIIDFQQGEEVGIKSVSFIVKGKYAYGYLKSESGVHRLIRISPFDSNKRRHTTFASVEIIPQFEDKIEIDLKEEDLKIDVYRSSGAGGQSVNTTDSAVRITHIPTKTVVTCQNERSQIKNKEKALELLKNKLYLKKIEERDEELRKIRGNKVEINFGSQIRSYVMHPYSMVKDHRTNYETSNVYDVLDGNLNAFIEAYLREVK